MHDDAGFWLPVLSEKALRARFGAPVLARCQGLAVGPCQSPTQSETQGAARRVQARVQGSRQPYRCHLHLEPGSALRGACDCAQGELGRACKHQAALALAWRRQLTGAPAQAPDGAVAARLAVAALFDALPADAKPAQLQTLIPSLQAWRAQEPRWALAAAEQALPPLCERLTTLQAERGWAEGEAEWRSLAEAVVDELFAAWRLLGPQPAAYAETYLALLATDPLGLIDPRRALTLLGPAVAERVGALLRQRWEAGEAAQDYLLHLAASGDEAERIRVLAAVCEQADATAGQHAAHVQALLQAGQGRAALAAAERAQRRFPQDRALETLLQARYEADGWDDEAQGLRRRALLREPSREAYQALLAAGDAEAERAQLWDALQAAPASRETGSLRLWLCIDEARFDEGLAWLAAHPGFAELALQDFLQSLPAAHAEEATALLKRALEQALHRARPPFSAELALLRELLARLSPEAGRLYTSWLRLQHRRRPDLVAALKGLGECRP